MVGSIGPTPLIYQTDSDEKMRAWTLPHTKKRAIRVENQE